MWKGRVQKAEKMFAQAIKALEGAHKAQARARKKTSGARRKEARGCSKDKHGKKPRTDTEVKKEKEA